MQRNPYNFTGPLHPLEDKPACISRSKEIEKIITGTCQGDYWVILGPRQIGKTTLLRQIKHELSVYPCIYIDLEISPKTEEAFYDWIINIIHENFDEKPAADNINRWKDFGCELNFYNFLKKFRPGKDKKIVLFFDEIEKAPAVQSFLNMWRKIFHERIDHRELNKYALIIAGSVELIPLTIGPTSPFNIAKKLYLDSLSKEESEQLIDEPFKELGISVEPGAREKLITETSGHPQLLQHICYILAEQLLGQRKSITAGDVEHAIERLFIESDNLRFLNQQIKTDETLEELVRRVLDGEEIEYAPYQHLSLSLKGTGPVVRQGSYCAIRNRLYERFLSKVIGKASLKNNKKQEPRGYKTSIYLKEAFDEGSIVENEEFLKCLFNPYAVSITIEWQGSPPRELGFNRTEKLIFCYLVYENHKARRDGFSSSMKNYHLSSVPLNNNDRQPEWDIFADAMNKEGSLFKNSTAPDATIRTSIHNIRKKLEGIGAYDLIPRQHGRGGGYWLEGTVTFPSARGA
ncbi:MAG: AAA-like domain-containing protein [Candidatus Aminicenantes bacterium]|nr:MAG: AAA-like domain-containing protein [Candidatus Aminicenantes bacterium]